MDAKEGTFHESIKPSWGPEGTLIYGMPSTPAFAMPSRDTSNDAVRPMLDHSAVLVSQGKDIRFAHVNPGNVQHYSFP